MGWRVRIWQVLVAILVIAGTAQAKDWSGQVRKIYNPATGNHAQVNYTAQGVPFITATTEADLFYTQGLIVTEYRLWQIEIYRRSTRGTLSEIWPVALPLDINARRMQWKQVCLENIANTSDFYLDVLQSYLDGANVWINQVRQNSSLLPPEYAMYGVPAPEPLTLVDTFMMVKFMSTALSGDARDEPRNQVMLDTVGQQRFDQFFALDPAMPYIQPPYKHSNYSRAAPILPAPRAARSSNQTTHEFHARRESFDSFFEEAGMPEDGWDMIKEWLPFSSKNYRKETHLQGALGDFLKSFPPKDLARASNSWAVSGEHTKSGLPIFSNDPHLTYSAPIIWIIVGLHVDAPDSKWNHVVGVTTPMAPGIGIGRNDHVAWGYTMVESDTQDLFVMDNLPGDKSYNYKGQVYNYEITSELINVKNSSPYNVTLYRSVYGPVIPDNDGTFYSLRWTAQFSTDTSVEALYDQCVAKTSEEYAKAVGKWWSLSFNAVYADTKGNIGYHTTGAIPQRQPQDTGLLPKPGDGTMDWIGIIPYNDLTHFTNPSEGFIVTANNPTAPPSEETVYFTGHYAPGFRAQRIIDMLTERIKEEKVDVEYMASIQASVVDLVFSYLYPTFSRLQLTDSSAQKWQQRLLAWDGNSTISSQEATIFNEFAVCLYNVTFYELGYGWEDPYRTALVFNNASTSGAGDDASCSYWNQTCLQYASQCFTDVVAMFPIHVPAWGAIPHYAFFPHVIPVPVHDNLFVQVGGSGYTPNAAHAGGTRGPVLAGPSMRFIADLSGQVPNQMILPGGESADPTSKHYSDQLPYWAKVETLPMDWSLYSQ